MRKLKLLLAACALFGVTATAWAQKANLTEAKGWTKNAALPEDLNNYFFAIYDSEQDLGMVLGTGNHQGAEFKTMYYRASVNPEVDKYALWTLSTNDNCQVVANANYPDFMLQTEWNAAWYYRTHDNGGGSLEWGRVTFAKPDGKYTIQNGKYPDSGYLGPWDNTIEDGAEVALNKTGDAIGTFDVYAITRGQYVANTAADATESNPVDISYVITNPGAERRQTIGWSHTGSDMAIQDNKSLNGTVGSYYFERFSNGGLSDCSFYQKLTNLPNGKYRFSALTVGGAGFYVYANSSKTVTTGTHERVSAIVNVTNGELEFGVKAESTTANWIAFDDAQLEYMGIDLDAYKEQLTELRSTANGILTGEVKLNAAVKSALQDAYDNTSTVESTKAALETAITLIDGALNDAEASIAVYTSINSYLTFTQGKVNADYSSVTTKINNGTYETLAEAMAEIKNIRNAFVLNTAVDQQDLSMLIDNPGFELGNINYWTVGASSDTGARATDNATYSMSNSEGSYLFNTWSQGLPLTQSLGILPAGTYSLSAVVASDGATVYLLINDDHSTFVKTLDKTIGLPIGKSFILSEAKEVTIGVIGGAGDGSYTAAGHWWYKADNFKLMKGEILPSSITALSPTSKDMMAGEVYTFEAPIVGPENAANKALTWSSSDTSVATVENGVVKAVGKGTATITAASTAVPSVNTTATVSVTIAAAPVNWSDIADVDQGDFFIRNVGTGKFLGGANSWGTQASLIKHGIPFGLTKIADGKYTLNSYTYNSESDHFFNGTYVDKPTTDILVTKLSNGNYALSTAENSYVTAKAGTTVVDNSATSSNASLAQWQFLSADDMLKNLKAGDTDATFFLSEANISRNLRKSNGASAWTGIKYEWGTWEDDKWVTKSSISGFAYGGANENQCGETYHKQTNSYQTVSVPNGTYTVRVQGFYRPDNGSANASYLYANVGGEDVTVALKTLGTEGDAGGMNDASNLFSNDKYWNVLSNVTVTNNKLTVGIKTDDENNWTIWDNFELELTSGGVFNVEPAITNGDYYLANSGKYITRRGGTDGERNEGVLANEGELLAKVTTNTAGISIISFYEKGDGVDGTDGNPIKERLFLSTNQVYTDGKRHVEKNYHHHYWAIEAVDGGYKLRNIEDGRYLDVAGEGNPIAVTVSETGAVWTFDNELMMSQNKLAAVIAEAEAIDTEANVGDAAFQIPTAAATTFTTAVNDAKNGSYSTAAEVNAAIAAVEAAILVYQQVELNEPDADKLYNIINVSEGYHHAGKAVTFKSAKDADLTGNTTSMGYNEQPGSIYPQGVKFIKTESRNAYKLCYTRADGNTVYVSTGTLSGLADGHERIRPTTEPDKALVVIVIATQKDGVWNLANTMADKNLGANGADDQGFFTVNWYNDMKLQEAVEAEVELTIDATNQYATCILPFDVAIPAGVVAYSVPSVTGSTLNLTEVLTGTLVANTPYVLFAEDGLAETSLKGLGAAYTDATYTEGLLTGVYANTYAPVGSYVLQKQGDVTGFYKVAEDRQPNVPANRVYLTAPSEARALYFNNATSIRAIEALTSGEAEIYNAAGARQNSLQKGVNIIKQGNKTFKVMVK